MVDTKNTGRISLYLRLAGGTAQCVLAGSPLGDWRAQRRLTATLFFLVGGRHIQRFALDDYAQASNMGLVLRYFSRCPVIIFMSNLPPPWLGPHSQSFSSRIWKNRRNVPQLPSCCWWTMSPAFLFSTPSFEVNSATYILSCFCISNMLMNDRFAAAK